MPIYTYLCKKCNEKFDLLVGIGRADEEIKCKKCGSKDIQKTLTSFNVGSGSSHASDSCKTRSCNLNSSGSCLDPRKSCPAKSPRPTLD